MFTDMDPNASDTDQIFEPLGRCRAFTWHGDLNSYHAANSSIKPDLAIVVKDEHQQDTNYQKDDVLNLKKPSTRRNAWGCMSYADLITKAIESVPEKRLTLSQIYAWMIQNVPYFKDKGESNSSAGWKNSVRHNLSLHRKFVRVQNEGTGKSSWWIVNSEAKSCKCPRRRAASMDNKSYEKKKRQAAVQPNIQEQSPMTGYSQSNIVPTMAEVQRLDSFAAAFSPNDLRLNGRTAALKSGLLSPIEAISESSLDDQVMTQPSPLYWNQSHGINPSYAHPEGLTETVGESLAELFTPDMNTSYEPAFSPVHQLTVLQNVSNDKYISDSSYLSFQDLGVTLPSPPPYTGHPATSEGFFAQVSTKDMLQSTASSNQLDAFSGVQYMTRSGYSGSQGMQDDVPLAQKYYAERGEESFTSESRSNSVLRQMLMQTQQKSILLSGYVDGAVESVIKSESVTADAFSYPEAHSHSSKAMFPGRSVLASTNQSHGCEMDYREPEYRVKLEPEIDD